MEYLAHLDKEKNNKQYLKEHLEAVANLINMQVSPTVEFDGINNLIIKEFSYYMGYSHDIGKYSDYFQEYLKTGKDNALKNHAHISACYLYNLLYEKAAKHKMDDKDMRIIIFLYYICVRLHHASLRVDASLFSNNRFNDLKILEKHFSERAKNILVDLKLEGEITIDEFCKHFSITSLEGNKRYFEFLPSQFKNGRISNPKWYFLLIYIFSLLIDMDKLDSALIKPNITKSVSPDNVTDYLNRKHGADTKSDLINRREKARKSMVSVINNLTDEEVANTHFFILTAPTGIGKTLSSLQSVLHLQKRIKQIEKYTPEIIVAIPFINIIEQNKLEYENVFGEELKMVVHHRLADFSLNNNSKEEIPIDKALLKTEAWDGDIVLTTFVQLFQSIFTGENKLLKKINKLAGSIVILDEAQSVPQEYMPVIGASLQLIAKYYGTRFVLMTATQPKLLELGDKLLSMDDYKGDEYKRFQLLPDYKKYFEGLKRTKFVPLLDKALTNEEFIELLFKKWSLEKSSLIVVNTIKKSVELYNAVKKKIEENRLNIPVYYLSTNIIPIKRRQVIKEVRGLLENKEPVILVSTQTIEAGVDMDFDMAFRDFAPIDSLIQTAGRVNRAGKKGEYLPIYIVELGNDNQYVYGLSYRKLTEFLLKGKEEILESDYSKLTEDYYNFVSNEGVSDESKNIWNGMIKLDFDAVKELKLIKDIEEVYDVFVEIDEKAELLANAFEEIIKYDGQSNFEFDLSSVLGESYKDKYKGKLGIFERKALLKLIEGKMSDYIIQIRASKIQGNKPIPFKIRSEVESNMLWIPFDQLDEFYDRDTGFKDNSGKAHIY